MTDPESQGKIGLQLHKGDKKDYVWNPQRMLWQKAVPLTMKGILCHMEEVGNASVGNEEPSKPS